MQRRRKALPEGLELDTTAPESIGFRLADLDYRRALGERAAKLGISAHELAKAYVIERLLDAQEQEALRVAVKATNDDIAAFRDDFAYAVQALLSVAGKLPKDEAKAWVEDNIKPE